MTVTCGATEAMVAAMLGLLDPGDEVVVFEPYYENYGPDAILTGAVPRYVTLHEPDWSIDPDELRAAFGPRTRAIVVNSPHNPTGKVFRRDELELIAALCVEFDAIAFTDDIYEHIVFEGEHIPLATLPGMADRTVSIHSMSKSYSVTGWRIGWTIASPELSVGIRRVHDFLTVGAAAPLQAAAVVALGFPRRLLRRAGGRLPGAARPARAGPPRGRLPDPRAGRRVLRHDRHRATWPSPARTTSRSRCGSSATRASRPCPARRSSRARSSAGRSCASRSRSGPRRSRRPPSGSPCSPSGLDERAARGSRFRHVPMTGGQTMGTTSDLLSPAGSMSSDPASAAGSSSRTTAGTTRPDGSTTG